MITLNTKYGNVKIFTDNIEQEALSQIVKMANSPLGENANIRIMPDCHAGAGCTIGTTMKITDKVCPNVVGVDIGCGVTLLNTNIDFYSNLEQLDNIIRENIPYGKKVQKTKNLFEPLKNLKCWDKLNKDVRELAELSLGSLGGGNHFIEAYANGFISVHSGSRNIGYKVAQYYQNLAEKSMNYFYVNKRKLILEMIEPTQREQWLKENKIDYEKELAFLVGQDMQDYLHDIEILQQFANENRMCILNTIVKKLNGDSYNIINSIHNYIDTKNMILRKGAISAELGEKLVIPLNMRDGLLICVGKGNEDWNSSAPHGAGRLYSRTIAKKIVKLEDYKQSMDGIYSTCINENTLDESPFAYKDYQEIMQNIEPTVTIKARIKPIYNFKANQKGETILTKENEKECIYDINGYCMYIDKVCQNSDNCMEKEILEIKKENENNDRQTNIK